MASPFARLAAVAAVTHDRIIGEGFTFRPMKFSNDRNAPAIVDPDRPVAERVIANFIEPAARAAAGPFNQVGVTPDRGAHSSSRPAISLQLSRVPYRLRRGDSVIRDETGTKYRVYEILPSVPGFVRLTLNEA